MDSVSYTAFPLDQTSTSTHCLPLILGTLQYKVIAVDVEAFRWASGSGPVHIKDFTNVLIPEDKGAHLEDASILGHDRLQLKRLASDHVGTLVAYGRRTQKFFVWLTGFDTPGIAVRYDFSESNGGKAVGTWKVNCFDDFIAASEWNKYAAKGYIAINGCSNGGLLVSTCVNRAPGGLLGAAIAKVGVHGLLKFADFTIGRAWTSDYDDLHVPQDFDFIYPISPPHNDKILPPTLLLAADPTLQHVAGGDPNPLLLRLELKARHGAGKITMADKWSFVAKTIGLK
ncbi:prolyl oligopeptidase family-domain-containing protein [Lactarius deliciosus]|nr:prolyl oligopeptidase family-domain-containing protein [Lactarius deliciosus]